MLDSNVILSLPESVKIAIAGVLRTIRAMPASEHNYHRVMAELSSLSLIEPIGATIGERMSLVMHKGEERTKSTQPQQQQATRALRNTNGTSNGHDSTATPHVPKADAVRAAWHLIVSVLTER